MLGQVPVLEPKPDQFRLTGSVEAETHDERGNDQPEREGCHNRQAHHTARNAHGANASTAIGHDLDRPVGWSLLPGTGGSV